MTTGELAEVLRKAGLPQSERVAAFPGAVKETSLDFLKGGGTYLEATLDTPLHSEVLHFVRQGRRLIAIQPGPRGREQITKELDISVRSADAALRYVRWLFDVTSEGGFWLLESVDDVPFLATSLKDKDLQGKIDVARKDLESEIKPPRAEESGPVFVVHLDAVAGRDLVRYAVKVSRLGLPSIEVTTVAHDLPVVYVVSG